MKYTYISICITLLILPHIVYAAKITLEQKSGISSGLIQMDVMLDPEGQVINTAAGSIAIPPGYFTVPSISTTGSVVSFWLTQPREVDASRIEFEGAMPGGFAGTRSVFYQRAQPGKLFSFFLRPEQVGTALLVLKNVDVRLNDGKATKVPVEMKSYSMTIPSLSTLPHAAEFDVAPVELATSSLETFITKERSVTGDKFVLMIIDDAYEHLPKSYSIAETDMSDPHQLNPYEWKPVVFPYELSYQARNKFIHIKSEYMDGAYAYTTIKPVENYVTKQRAWHILIIIGLILLGYELARTYRSKSHHFSS